jgi:hypothetical protein
MSYPLSLEQIAEMHADCPESDCDVKPCLDALRKLREAAQSVVTAAKARGWVKHYHPEMRALEAVLAKVMLRSQGCPLVGCGCAPPHVHETVGPHTSKVTP